MYMYIDVCIYIYIITYYILTDERPSKKVQQGTASPLNHAPTILHAEEPWNAARDTQPKGSPSNPLV